MPITRDQVKQHVLAVFEEKWPGQVVEATNLRGNLRLIDGQVLTWVRRCGQGWKGVKLVRSEMVACGTIKDIIDLIWGKLKKMAPTSASLVMPKPSAEPKLSSKPKPSA